MVDPEHDPEDDYRESEDEDYNPGAVDSGSDASDGEQDGGEDEAEAVEESGIKVKDYASIQGGGLIKSRARRKAEDEAESKSGPSVVGEASVDVNALWAEMNAPTPSKPEAESKSTKSSTSDSSSATTEEYITIERRFEFAGKTTTEQKRVLRSSAEGQQYLQEQKELRENTPANNPDREKLLKEKAKRGPVKRKMSLLEEYQAGKAKKITTLEKSRLDWLGFVDQEGINADLKKHNKSGYLDKQGFLARVEHNIDQDLRSNRPK